MIEQEVQGLQADPRSIRPWLISTPGIDQRFQDGPCSRYEDMTFVSSWDQSWGWGHMTRFIQAGEVRSIEWSLWSLL